MGFLGKGREVSTEAQKKWALPSRGLGVGSLLAGGTGGGLNVCDGDWEGRGGRGDADEVRGLAFIPRATFSCFL